MTQEKAGLASLVVRALRRLANNELQKHLWETRFTVLDAEMTGLNLERDDLLAIGAVRMFGPRIVIGERFYSLIRPQQTYWGASVTIHGIRPIDVAEAPGLERVLPAFLEFIQDTVLVGHGVEVDRKFLERAAKRIGCALPRALWIDTGRVARWLNTHHGAFLEVSSDKGRFGLEELLIAYEIEPPARHHALADAFVTAQIWQRQLYALAAEGVRTLRELRLLGLC